MSSSRSVVSWVEWMTVMEVVTIKSGRKHFVVVVDGWKIPREISGVDLNTHFVSCGGVNKSGHSWKFRSRLKVNQSVTMALLKWGTR